VHCEPVAEPETIAWQSGRQSGALGGGDGRRHRPRGRIAAVSDEAILDTTPAASREGVFASRPRPRPGGPARPRPRPEGGEPPKTVVCVLTGHGLKDPDTCWQGAAASAASHAAAVEAVFD
jgi:threonine synthase